MKNSSHKQHFYLSFPVIWQATETNPLPDVSFVPPLLRRRLTAVEKIGLFLAHTANTQPLDCYTVFSSRFGEWGQTIRLIQQLHEEESMSPAGFSTSVHNAMPGLYSLISGSKQGYTAIAANEQTIDAGLTETFTAPHPTLFIYAEEATPSFYRNHFSDPFAGHGCAFVLTKDPIPGSIGIDFIPCFSKQTPFLTFADLVHFLGKGEVLKTRFFEVRKCS